LRDEDVGQIVGILKKVKKQEIPGKRWGQAESGFPEEK